MENNTNNPEFMDDINADDLFIEADARDDVEPNYPEHPEQDWDDPVEFHSMDAMAPGVVEDVNPYDDEDDCEDDSWTDGDSLASAGWGTDEDYGDWG
jgi:hypothetical protein